MWDTLQKRSDQKGLSIQQTAIITTPFVMRLLIEGESVIGDDAVFSGAVVMQFLLTILETMDLKSANNADMKIKILRSVLDDLSRPVVIGDEDQNVLITDDRYYIEYFTFSEGKYQIVMVATPRYEESDFPMIRGETLPQLTTNT